MLFASVAKSASKAVASCLLRRKYLSRNARDETGVQIDGPRACRRALEVDWMASTSAPSSWRAELEAFALRVAKAGAQGAPSDGPTFLGLDAGDRAAVHDAARKLGLASKSEGSDDDGTRAVRVFARKRPAWTHASAGLANGDARASVAEADDTAADADASPHGPSAFEESLVDLRDTPFDMYKALRIPRRESGGYSGGTARARASYHREAVRCYPVSDGRPGRGACDGCGGALRLGRWMHRPSPLRADAPADDPEFGLLDDEEDDGGDAIVASAAGGRGSNKKPDRSESPPASQRLRRRDLCPPCFARETRARPAGARGGDIHAVDPAEGFVAIESFVDLGRERPRYDVAAYAAFRKRRAAAADAAAAENAFALAAVAGPEAMARAAEMRVEKESAFPAETEHGDAERDATSAPIERNAARPEKEAKETTRFAAEVARFQRVTIAYLTLRDPERLRVLDEHGYAALVKSEALSERDVFDCDPWDVYERFFAGEDEEDRQYLLLHGGAEDSDDEDERDASDGDSDDDAFVEEALREAKHERFDKSEEGDKRAAAFAPPPKPPVSVLMAMGGEPGAPGDAEDDEELPCLGGADVWKVMSERYSEDALAEAARARADATDEDSDIEAASDSEEVLDPWTHDRKYVVCPGCPEEDDRVDSAGEDAPSVASDDDDGPPEETATKRKREDEADDGEE